MDLKINGKLGLVTGGGRGIGMGICKSLDREGVKLVIVSRGKEGLENLKRELLIQDHIFLEMDLEEIGKPGELINFLVKENLYPDILINNLGGNLNFVDPLKTLSGWHKVMRLNLDIAIELNEAFIPNMQKKKWGRVCHISSISALENQGPPAYCAAKAALNAYVRSLGRYVSSDNVILTTVMPGAIFTEGGYWDNALKNRPDHVEKYLSERMAIKRFGTVEEISEIVAFLCSDLSSFCVGSNFLVDGGQGKVFYPSEIV